jgi:hypothetical protein
MSRVARGAVLGVAAALALSVLALWPVGERRPALEQEATAAHSTSPLVAAEVVRPSTESAAPVVPSAAPPAQRAVADGGDLHPHPITREHEVLQQELRLVGALQDALDLEDVSALRSLIARYRAHVPGDENKLAEGYARLADCLEVDARDHDPVAVRAAAEAYYQNERASTLRRYIRRVCLER